MKMKSTTEEIAKVFDKLMNPESMTEEVDSENDDSEKPDVEEVTNLINNSSIIIHC